MKMLTNQFFLHKKSSSEHSSPPQSLNTWFLFTSVLLPHLDNPTGFSPSIQLDLINTSSWSSPPLVVLVMTLLQGTQGLVNQEPSGQSSWNPGNPGTWQTGPDWASPWSQLIFSVLSQQCFSEHKSPPHSLDTSAPKSLPPLQPW